MLDVIWIALKIGLFCAIVAGLHVTSTREIVDLYGRAKLAIVAIGALLLGILANWFLAGSSFFEREFWHSMKFSDNSAVTFISFGIGLLVQVIRFRRK